MSFCTVGDFQKIKRKIISILQRIWIGSDWMATLVLEVRRGFSREVSFNLGFNQ